MVKDGKGILSSAQLRSAVVKLNVSLDDLDGEAGLQKTIRIDWVPTTSPSKAG